MRTNFYIDGFNLYYLALKGTQFKWLDLYQVCQDLAPTHQVNRIRYFTARVKPRPNDPQQATRQAIYLRALETISVLTIHYGHFRDRKKFRRLVTPIPGYPHTVEVWNTEEKGTDVNLASYLLLDGFQNEYEQAFVISNDSDLALPIEKIRDQLKLPIGIVNPNPNPKGITPNDLTSAATFVRRLQSATLQNCQFQPQLQDSVGTITKPADW